MAEFPCYLPSGHNINSDGCPVRLAENHQHGLRAPREPAKLAAEEVGMDDLVDVTIPVEPEVARALESPARREAAGRVLSSLLKGGRVRDVLAEAIADAKAEARANGLTDEEIDRELEAWRAEKRD